MGFRTTECVLAQHGFSACPKLTKRAVDGAKHSGSGTQTIYQETRNRASTVIRASLLR